MRKLVAGIKHWRLLFSQIF